MGDSMRKETDSLGEIHLPEKALYGASTQRAVENFPVSGLRMPRGMIRALGLIKQAAAETNVSLGLLDPILGEAIAAAAGEVAEGLWDDHFPVDIFQTGSGTSTNMNANEVIANRCAQLAGKPLGSRDYIHPNDHVNLGQSSNDVMPSALHLAVSLSIREDLMPALQALGESLAGQAAQFHDVIKL
ncbi:MAG: aspartate ammonia-lyase, partial [Verrucomicrobiae bacterium]|nr:aspartate ammonia-lyase [Verrucomicrobiae bacterium]